MEIQFVEIPWRKDLRCNWCGAHIHKSFYRAYIGENSIGIYCNLCKSGWESFVRSSNQNEGHIIFFAENEIERLSIPADIRTEISNGLLLHRRNLLREALRNYGNAGEMLTKELFVRYFGEEKAKEIPKWEDRIGRLRNQTSKEKEDTIGNFCLVELMDCVCWYRNKVSHPTMFNPNSVDLRIALMAVLDTCAKMFPVAVKGFLTGIK